MGTEFWPPDLPATAYDRYVDPAGSDTAAGTQPGTAWQTFEKVANAAPTYCRVYVMPGDHQVDNICIPENKKIQFIGKPIPTSLTGHADPGVGYSRIYATSNMARFFDIRPLERVTTGGNLYGGGFRGLYFDMTNITESAIRVRNGNYMKWKNLVARAPAGSFKQVRMFYESESNYASSAAVQDRSWCRLEDIRVFNCAIMYKDQNYTMPTRGSNGWTMYDLYGDSDAPAGATLPYFWNDRVKAHAMMLKGGHFNNVAAGVSAILIDQRNETSSPSFSMEGVTFSNLRTPFYGLEVRRGHIHVKFPAGGGSAGLIYGDAEVDGYVDAPQALTAGAIASWPNFPWQNQINTGW